MKVLDQAEFTQLCIHLVRKKHSDILYELLVGGIEFKTQTKVDYNKNPFITYDLQLPSKKFVQLVIYISNNTSEIYFGKSYLYVTSLVHRIDSNNHPKFFERILKHFFYEKDKSTE